MNILHSKIHALVLTAALAVAMVSFAANSAYAQVINLLFEDRAADVKIGEEFEALNGPFEIRWSATDGKITVRLLGPDGQPKIAGDPQSRLDDEPPMIGKMSFAGPGKFKIAVDASGPWHIRVVQ